MTAVFAGHYHTHRGPSAFDDPPACNPCDPFEMITTARVGHTPATAGFRLVRVFDDRIEHELFPIDLPPALIAGASWRYLDNVSNFSSPPADWQTATFQDDAWASGTGMFGFGPIPDLNTVVGSRSVEPPITTYFRTSVDIDDPEAFASYQLGVLHDDGAVVYVNGEEVFRPNMPKGTIVHTTMATPPVAGPPEDLSYLPGGLSPDALVTGSNVIAVEVHQAVDLTTDDLAFDLELRGVSPSTLIESRSFWIYNDTSIRAPEPDDGDAWYEPGYRPTGWSKAETPIGDPGALPASPAACGPADPDACGVTTTVNTAVGSDPCFPGASEESRTTTYFRREFEVLEPNAFAEFTLELTLVDGGVVYLNGIQLESILMPTGVPIEHCTLALPSRWPAGTKAIVSIAPGDLQPGTNLLAVEVHRKSEHTETMVFDVSLTGSNP